MTYLCDLPRFHLSLMKNLLYIYLINYTFLEKNERQVMKKGSAFTNDCVCALEANFFF